MSSFEKNLPATWELTSLGEVYRVVGGGTPSTETPAYWNGVVPWITSADIEGVRKINIRKYVTETGITESATNKVPAKTLLVVTRVGLGKIAIAESPICFSQDLQGLIQDPELICPEYTLHLLSYELQILKFQGRGTTISGVTKKQLKDLGFPLPPVNEQRRIVAKIDQLISELDKSVDSLKTAFAQLNVYRHALLKYAFDGRLTARWREEQQDKLESSLVLLNRIKTTRKQRYNKELDDWKRALEDWEANPRTNRKPVKPSSPQEPAPLNEGELESLPSLPQGWLWVKIGQVFDVYVGSTPSRKRSDYWGGEIPWVSSGEVAFCRIKATVERITPRGLNSASRTIHPVGTVLLGMIGEGKTRGQAAILEIEAAHNQNSAAIRVSETECLPEYIYNYFLLFYEVIRAIGSGNNQKALNKDRVAEIKFPLPSVAEQQVLITLLDERLSRVEKLQSDIREALSRSYSLRLAILKKAFSGQLVRQDPTDESASMLLTRIKAKMSAQTKPATRQKTNRKRKALRKRAVGI